MFVGRIIKGVNIYKFMENNMKCEKCDGMMKKSDDHNMKCDKCGHTMKMDHGMDHSKDRAMGKDSK